MPPLFVAPPPVLVAVPVSESAAPVLPGVGCVPRSGRGVAVGRAAGWAGLFAAGVMSGRAVSKPASASRAKALQAIDAIIVVVARKQAIFLFIKKVLRSKFCIN
jgi:hypothetical protein